jgi:hypothetical protein
MPSIQNQILRPVPFMHFQSLTSFGPVSGKKSSRIARDPGKKWSNKKMALIELVGNSI